MRDAADNVAQNQIGKALGQEASAGAVLDEMLDILANRRDQELSRLVAKLREAEQQLAGLRKEQDGLRKRLKELAAAFQSGGSQAVRPSEKPNCSDWPGNSTICSSRPSIWSANSQRLQAQRAADATAQAGGAMDRAGQSAENGDAAEAGQQRRGGAKRSRRRPAATGRNAPQGRSRSGPSATCPIGRFVEGPDRHSDSAPLDETASTGQTSQRRGRTDPRPGPIGARLGSPATIARDRDRAIGRQTGRRRSISIRAAQAAGGMTHTAARLVGSRHRREQHSNSSKTCSSGCKS